ncbi:hypothetical protein GCM10007063_08200 [Lentibacillus kapialis]|uniref:Serine protease n=1 Tax=Lentibacillus kapialis TaxID=340214 RepID=A0A917PQN4_9BACI|nr:serine protease [Lentibacillus kapialis]GGJ88065.1 hypothetical protein GCM10007063_08200 [Lentibacillus kapialis]
MDNNKRNRDVVDDDLYEELDEDELYDLVEQEREKALARTRENKKHASRHRFPKWVFWLIAAVMVLNVVSLIPRTFSIPAINFLVSSAQLSAQEDIQTYKESVVVIEADGSRGTGFSISSDGTIITNHHVIEDEESVTVAYPAEGLFSGKVVASYPSVDLAVLDVSGEKLPYLELADAAMFDPGDEQVFFIGNPIRFSGIANKGRVLDTIELSGWDKPVVMMEAPVYRGNSGSPVINQDGKVIGVVFATLHHETHGRVGLFIPIEYYHNRQD